MHLTISLVTQPRDGVTKLKPAPSPKFKFFKKIRIK